MNGQLNFPIADKSIYQMGFNSAAPPTVPNYVTEPTSLTNHLQILEMLNPQNATDDKKRELIAELMTPHYEKQAEIEKKIDNLTETLHNFIQAQQRVNDLVIEKYFSEKYALNVEEATRMEEENEEENEQNHQLVNNPMPVYAIPQEEPPHSPIRNRSISPEKLETGMSVRDFLKNTMTVQKADDKILKEERERDRVEAAQPVRYNKFRVRNRPKKYKRSAVTFTSTSSEVLTSSIEQQNAESEEHVVQPPIVVPCVQRATDLELALMQPVFPTTSSYVLNPQPPTLPVPDTKFPADSNNLWKAVDGVTQLLVDAPSLLESDLRSFADHSHHSSFLPFVGNQEHHPRSAFVPPYHKDRRVPMDPNLTEMLRNL